MATRVTAIFAGVALALLVPVGCTGSNGPNGEDGAASGTSGTGPGGGAFPNGGVAGVGANSQGGGVQGGAAGFSGTAGAPAGAGGTAGVGGATGGVAPTGGAAGSSACGAGLSPCGAECKNLVQDLANCGSCGRACRTDQTCAASACACAPGSIECSGVCVSSDAMNCGVCGRACAAGQVCSAGLCSSSGCAAGLTQCGSSCFDITGHRNNCGACGRMCPADQDCSASMCRCRTGMASCNGGACQDVLSDEANCGTCGNRCATGATCTNGACVCPNAGIPCSGVCVDPNSDEAHCGNCTTTCGGTTQCLSGGCVDPTSVNCGGAAAGRVCTRDAFITLGKYWVNNNQWGVSGGVTGQQCIFSRCQTGDLVGWGTDWQWTGGSGGVKTYVSLVFGWQWGWRIPNTGLPVQISAGRAVNCGWNYTVNTTGTINVSYDMWLHTINNPTFNSDPSDEVMVWLYRSGGAGPIGTLQQSNVMIGGHPWNLYRGMNGTTNVFSYIRTTNATTAVLNMMSFLNDLVTRGWMQSSKYLSSVQAGTEVYTGSGDLNVNGFYCRIQ